MKNRLCSNYEETGQGFFRWMQRLDKILIICSFTPEMRLFAVVTFYFSADLQLSL